MRLYESKTNEELVALLQIDIKDEVFEELFNRFIPMIYNVRNIYPIPGFQIDDYFQEGRITMFHAIDSFEGARNVYFASFLHTVYKNHIYNKLRKIYSSKRRDVYGDLSFDTSYITSKSSREVNILEYIPDPNGLEPEETIMIRERADNYFSQLSPLEKKTIVSFLGHSSYEHVAEELDISIDTVRSAMSRARRKIRVEFSELN